MKVGMKQYGLIFLLLFTAFVSQAQDKSDFIRRGDEAMKEMNYSLAKTYYDAVVVSACDFHSINQLTTIWLSDESMRADMSSTMKRCFICLDDGARKLQDTTSIQLLVTYYTQGIGTSQNTEIAAYWQQRLEEIRDPSLVLTRPNGDYPAREKKMDFFAGYSMSPIAPFGIQVGGLGKSVGWYVRFRTNFVFQNTNYEGHVEETVINGEKQNIIRIPELEAEKEGVMYRAGQTKTTFLTGSAGLMYKAVDNVFVSAGFGYWDRKYAREYNEVNDTGANTSSSGWIRDTEGSMNGVLIDLGGTYIISGKIYVSLGASLMDFKYVYPDLSVGFIF